MSSKPGSTSTTVVTGMEEPVQDENRLSDRAAKRTSSHDSASTTTRRKSTARRNLSQALSILQGPQPNPRGPAELKQLALSTLRSVQSSILPAKRGSPPQQASQPGEGTERQPPQPIPQYCTPQLPAGTSHQGFLVTSPLYLGSSSLHVVTVNGACAYLGPTRWHRIRRFRRRVELFELLVSKVASSRSRGSRGTSKFNRDKVSGAGHTFTSDDIKAIHEDTQRPIWSLYLPGLVTLPGQKLNSITSSSGSKAEHDVLWPEHETLAEDENQSFGKGRGRGERLMLLRHAHQPSTSQAQALIAFPVARPPLTNPYREALVKLAASGTQGDDVNLSTPKTHRAEEVIKEMIASRSTSSSIFTKTILKSLALEESDGTTKLHLESVEPSTLALELAQAGNELDAGFTYKPEAGTSEWMTSAMKEHARFQRYAISSNELFDATSAEAANNVVIDIDSYNYLEEEYKQSIFRVVDPVSAAAMVLDDLIPALIEPDQSPATAAGDKGSASKSGTCAYLWPRNRSGRLLDIGVTLAQAKEIAACFDGLGCQIEVRALEKEPQFALSIVDLGWARIRHRIGGTLQHGYHSHTLQKASARSFVPSDPNPVQHESNVTGMSIPKYDEAALAGPIPPTCSSTDAESEVAIQELSLDLTDPLLNPDRLREMVVALLSAVTKRPAEFFDVALDSLPQIVAWSLPAAQVVELVAQLEDLGVCAVAVHMGFQHDQHTASIGALPDKIPAGYPITLHSAGSHGLGECVDATLVKSVSSINPSSVNQIDNQSSELYSVHLTKISLRPEANTTRDGASGSDRSLVRGLSDSTTPETLLRIWEALSNLFAMKGVPSCVFGRLPPAQKPLERTSHATAMLTLSPIAQQLVYVRARFAIVAHREQRILRLREQREHRLREQEYQLLTARLANLDEQTSLQELDAAFDQAQAQRVQLELEEEQSRARRAALATRLEAAELHAESLQRAEVLRRVRTAREAQRVAAELQLKQAGDALRERLRHEQARAAVGQKNFKAEAEKALKSHLRNEQAWREAVAARERILREHEALQESAMLLEALQRRRQRLAAERAEEHRRKQKSELVQAGLIAKHYIMSERVRLEAAAARAAREYELQRAQHASKWAELRREEVMLQNRRHELDAARAEFNLKRKAIEFELAEQRQDNERRERQRLQAAELLADQQSRLEERERRVAAMELELAQARETLAAEQARLEARQDRVAFDLKQLQEEKEAKISLMSQEASARRLLETKPQELLVAADETFNAVLKAAIAAAEEATRLADLAEEEVLRAKLGSPAVGETGNGTGSEGEVIDNVVQGSQSPSSVSNQYAAQIREPYRQLKQKSLRELEIILRIQQYRERLKNATTDDAQDQSNVRLSLLPELLALLPDAAEAASLDAKYYRPSAVESFIAGAVSESSTQPPSNYSSSLSPCTQLPSVGTPSDAALAILVARRALEEQLEDAENRASASEVTRSAWAGELEALSAELFASRRQVSRLEKQAQHLQSRIREMETEASKLRQAKVKQVSEQQRLQEMLRVQEGQLQLLKLQQAQAEFEAKELRRQLEAKSDELELAESTCESLRLQQAQARLEAAEAREKLFRLGAQLDDALSALAAEQQHRGGLQSVQDSGPDPSILAQSRPGEHQSPQNPNPRKELDSHAGRNEPVSLPQTEGEARILAPHPEHNDNVSRPILRMSPSTETSFLLSTPSIHSASVRRRSLSYIPDPNLAVNLNIALDGPHSQELTRLAMEMGATEEEARLLAVAAQQFPTTTVSVSVPLPLTASPVAPPRAPTPSTHRLLPDESSSTDPRIALESVGVAEHSPTSVAKSLVPFEPHPHSARLFPKNLPSPRSHAEFDAPGLLSPPDPMRSVSVDPNFHSPLVLAREKVSEKGNHASTTDQHLTPLHRPVSLTLTNATTPRRLSASLHLQSTAGGPAGPPTRTPRRNSVGGVGRPVQALLSAVAQTQAQVQCQVSQQTQHMRDRLIQRQLWLIKNLRQQLAEQFEVEKQRAIQEALTQAEAKFRSEQESQRLAIQAEMAQLAEVRELHPQGGINSDHSQDIVTNVRSNRPSESFTHPQSSENLHAIIPIAERAIGLCEPSQGSALLGTLRPPSSRMRAPVDMLYTALATQVQRVLQSESASSPAPAEGVFSCAVRLEEIYRKLLMLAPYGMPALPAVTQTSISDGSKQQMSRPLSKAQPFLQHAQSLAGTTIVVPNLSDNVWHSSGGLQNPDLSRNHEKIEEAAAKWADLQRDAAIEESDILRLALNVPFLCFGAELNAVHPATPHNLSGLSFIWHTLNMAAFVQTSLFYEMQLSFVDPLTSNAGMTAGLALSALPDADSPLSPSPYLRIIAFDKADLNESSSSAATSKPLLVTRSSILPLSPRPAFPCLTLPLSRLQPDLSKLLTNVETPTNYTIRANPTACVIQVRDTAGLADKGGAGVLLAEGTFGCSTLEVARGRIIHFRRPKPYLRGQQTREQQRQPPLAARLHSFELAVDSTHLYGHSCSPLLRYLQTIQQIEQEHYQKSQQFPAASVSKPLLTACFVNFVIVIPRFPRFPWLLREPPSVTRAPVDQSHVSFHQVYVTIHRLEPDGYWSSTPAYETELRALPDHGDTRSEGADFDELVFDCASARVYDLCLGIPTRPVLVRVWATIGKNDGQSLRHSRMIVSEGTTSLASILQSSITSREEIMLRAIRFGAAVIASVTQNDLSNMPDPGPYHSFTDLESLSRHTQTHSLTTSELRALALLAYSATLGPNLGKEFLLAASAALGGPIPTTSQSTTAPQHRDIGTRDARERKELRDSILRARALFNSPYLAQVLKKVDAVGSEVPQTLSASILKTLRARVDDLVTRASEIVTSRADAPPHADDLQGLRECILLKLLRESQLDFKYQPIDVPTGRANASTEVNGLIDTWLELARKKVDHTDNVSGWTSSTFMQTNDMSDTEVHRLYRTSFKLKGHTADQDHDEPFNRLICVKIREARCFSRLDDLAMIAKECDETSEARSLVQSLVAPETEKNAQMNVSQAELLQQYEHDHKTAASDILLGLVGIQRIVKRMQTRLEEEKACRESMKVQIQER